jgi:heat-inducible transcriptional repressor
MMEPLSQRQQELLQRVVEEYVSTGQPVGSKTLVERGSLAVSSSTVRNDLAELERRGLMMHPHTSAGRVPTEAGYRLYVDELLLRPESRPDAIALGLPAARAEVE